jgi:hypothetical protein
MGPTNDAGEQVEHMSVFKKVSFVYFLAAV